MELEINGRSRFGVGRDWLGVSLLLIFFEILHKNRQCSLVRVNSGNLVYLFILAHNRLRVDFHALTTSFFVRATIKPLSNILPLKQRKVLIESRNTNTSVVNRQLLILSHTLL